MYRRVPFVGPSCGAVSDESHVVSQDGTLKIADGIFDPGSARNRGDDFLSVVDSGGCELKEIIRQVPAQRLGGSPDLGAEQVSFECV
jgi:hypothetical protein